MRYRYRSNPRGDVRVTPSSIELDRYPEAPARLPLTPVGRRMYTGEDPRKSMYGHATWIEEEHIPKSREAFKKVQYFVSQFDDKAVRKALDEMGVRYYSGRDDAQALRERLEGALYERLMPYEEKKNPRQPRKHYNPSSVEDVFHALQPGDWVEVTYAPRSSSSPDEKRTVIVEARSGRHVYVTSGKVRPGHRSGGAIHDYGGGEFYFQPTAQQPIRRVFALHRTAVLPMVRNPAGKALPKAVASCSYRFPFGVYKGGKLVQGYLTPQFIYSLTDSYNRARIREACAKKIGGYNALDRILFSVWEHLGHPIPEHSK